MQLTLLSYVFFFLESTLVFDVVHCTWSYYRFFSIHWLSFNVQNRFELWTIATFFLLPTLGIFKSSSSSQTPGDKSPSNRRGSACQSSRRQLTVDEQRGHASASVDRRLSEQLRTSPSSSLAAALRRRLRGLPLPRNNADPAGRRRVQGQTVFGSPHFGRKEQQEVVDHVLFFVRPWRRGSCQQEEDSVQQECTSRAICWRRRE